MAGASEQLAAWAATLRWSDIPPEVKRLAHLQILDVVGVMLAARHSEVVQATAKAMAVSDAGSEARALAFAQSLSLSGAAFVNGVMSSVLEFDDTHIESFVHPTIAPFSVALAHGQSKSVAGQDLMLATIVGSELSCRIGLIPPSRLHSVGIHPSAIMGAFGAVYALAKLQNASVQQIMDAIGHAASMCGGLMASWEDGASTKTLHVGMAASQSVRAIALAMQGVSGPATVYEGRYGWFRTHMQKVAPEDFRFDRALGQLGHEWEILNVASKPYPSAFTIHPYVDAVLALKNDHRIDPARIKEISCRMAPSSVATLCEPVAEKARPLTTWHGRISIQHSVAEAIIVGKMDKNAYAPEYLHDPRINVLADKVTYYTDPNRTVDAKKSGALVAFILDDGSRVEHEIDSVRGTRDNPISGEDYVAKFRSNAGGVIDDSLIDRTIDDLMNLSGCEDIAPMFDRLANS